MYRIGVVDRNALSRLALATVGEQHILFLATTKQERMIFIFAFCRVIVWASALHEQINFRVTKLPFDHAIILSACETCHPLHSRRFPNQSLTAAPLCPCVPDS